MDITKNLLIWPTWFFTDSNCDITRDHDDDIGDVDDGASGGYIVVLI